MRNIKVVLELEKIIPLNIKEGEDPKLKASRMIDEMIEIDKKMIVIYHHLKFMKASLNG